MIPGTILPRLAPRLTIGGIHFWGHADFHISFALPSIATFGAEESRLTAEFSPGVETGARFYPWRIEHGTLRPFVGIAWSVLSYAQSSAAGDGPTIFRHRTPLQFGASWSSQVGRLETGIEWTPGTETTYPTSKEIRSTIRLPKLTAWLGYRYTIDATAGLDYAERSGAIERMERRMDSVGALSTFSVAIGPSSAFTMSRSSHNRIERPYLDDRIPTDLFPDLSVGYYIDPIDAAIDLSYRPISSSQSGYGAVQESSRKVLSLEAIKFLADYNGFVPFVGLGIGREWLRFRESDGGTLVTDERRETWAPGIVFGWDIRPTRAEWFLLRTNLRYTPGLKIETAHGRDVAFDHLEVNFIQLLLYPARMAEWL
jgi:hypothetical protein